MKSQPPAVRVLYSFPHKLGAARISTTAWHQVYGAAAAGAEMSVLAGAICRPLPPQVRVGTTLGWKGIRLPYRLLGTERACALHDWRVARKLPALAGRIDVIHLWPLAALRTLRAAKRLGIPTVLERPNAHTQFAYAVVSEECRRLGLEMPRGHEHEENPRRLRREEAEYELADRLLCPSDFVARTFLERGFPPGKLVRHQYGFDERVYRPGDALPVSDRGLVFLFAGGCAPRKGLHYALEAWLASSAHRNGTFLVVGAFIPGYAEACARLLAHPSVRVLGHRHDLPELMRQSDALVLPSLEEGSALVTSEARGSGCVLLVSDAAGAICEHNENALVHSARDVATLTRQMDLLDRDRALLARLRAASLRTLDEITWVAAGRRLRSIYEEVSGGNRPSPEPRHLSLADP